MRAGGLRPRAGATPGATTSTAGASRSSPTAPAARGSTTASPAPYYVDGRRRRRGSCQGLNPGSPKYCGLEIVSGRHLPDDWQGDLHHQRLPRPPRLPVQVSATTARASPAASMPELIKTQPPGVPADRREDGARTARSTSPTGTTRSSSTARSISATRAATTRTAASGA